MACKEFIDQNERSLDQHSCEEIRSESSESMAENIFMAKCRNQENKEHGLDVAELEVVNAFNVEVTETPLMHWDVPFAPKLGKSRRISPVLIKPAISEANQLRCQVLKAMEERVEPQK